MRRCDSNAALTPLCLCLAFPCVPGVLHDSSFLPPCALRCQAQRAGIPALTAATGRADLTHRQHGTAGAGEAGLLPVGRGHARSWGRAGGATELGAAPRGPASLLPLIRSYTERRVAAPLFFWLIV